MPIFGWDASDFDWGRGPMDLGAAVRDGISFFTHKATEGTRIKHVHYGEALNRARAAGMPLVGAYIVPRTPDNNGHGTISQQVDYALAYLDAATPWWRSTPEFFLQVDTEHWGYDNVAPTYGAQMASLFRTKTGKWVIHYAPRWAYGDTIPGSEPLWASSYGSNPTAHYREAYPGDSSSGWTAYSGRTPTVLQYGSRLTIGSQPDCDGNAFRGSLDQLRALITGGTDVAQLDDIQTTEADDYWWSRATMTGRGKDGKPMQDTWDGAVIPGTRQLGEKLDALAAAVAKIPTTAAVTLSDAQLQAVIDGVTAKLAGLIPTPAQYAAAAVNEEAKRLGNG